jgi:hypothetical protein
MSDNTDFGFAKLVPGFDFLQNLAKGATQGMPQMPTLSSWIAPTLNVEELEKRIGELKAVHFWLDQNSKALSATIQALEVQKMTLATLRGMNFNMSEMAEALRMKPLRTEAKPEAKAAQPARSEPAADQDANPGNGAASPVDPLQWWTSLTQQFQEIASTAMKDVAQSAVVVPVKPAARAASAKKSAPVPSPAGAKKTPAGKTPRKRAAKSA